MTSTVVAAACCTRLQCVRSGSCFRGRLGLEPGCEKDEFKKVLKKTKAKIEQFVMGAAKAFKLIEDSKGAESRELWERAEAIREM